MGEKRKEDDPHWLQVLHKKEQLRSKRRRQVLIQKVLLIVLALAVVLAALLFVAGKGEKEQKPDIPAVEPDTATESFTVADPDQQKQKDEDKKHTEENTDVQQTDTDQKDTINAVDAQQTEADEEEVPDSGKTEDSSSKYRYQDRTRTLGNGISSTHAVLIDVENGTVLACKDEKSQMVPASMTKVLTLLTAVEHLGDDVDLEDKFKITVEITDYCYLNECSSAGFAIDEKVTVKDLLYGTILPSGADAALGLAEYVAGSQEAFVELMNAKLEEIGLSETAHFTNCVGIYDEDHYCTVLDMAAIMEAALSNETCREVLSARTYTTSKTKQHPEGILLSNWFLRRIEDKDTGGEVVCAKTGYVVQAGNCAVSYAIDQKERKYICVTANAEGSWKCIYDHVKIYKRFSKRK